LKTSLSITTCFVEDTSVFSFNHRIVGSGDPWTLQVSVVSFEVFDVVTTGWCRSKTFKKLKVYSHNSVI